MLKLESEAIDFSEDGPIAKVTLNRPSAKNALGPSEWRALGQIVDEVRRNPQLRVLMISGSGGVFSAGGDLKTMPERLAQAHAQRRANLLSDAQLILALRQLAKPTIAVIPGVAIGAGLSLALACDIRLASVDAKLGATFHRIGLTGDFGMLWLLPRIIGPTRAMDLLMSSRLVDGNEAARMGLITRAVELSALSQVSTEYAERLASGPGLAIGLTKQGIYRSLDSELADHLAWEADAQATCSRSADAQEGVRAFLEKRAPQFRGQ